MKKISLLLILAMLLSMTACRKAPVQPSTDPGTIPTSTTEATTEATTVPTTEATVPTTTAPELVTLYIPKEITIYGPDGTAVATATYIFEDGWEEKSSFTVTCATDIAGEGKLDMAFSYGDKSMVSEQTGVSKTEVFYDEQGRIVRQIVTPAAAGAVKTETNTTYDAQGRLLTVESKTDSASQTVTYTYTNTETGSKGVATAGGITYEVEYDKNNLLLKNVTTVNGQELSRVENTYDENGNVISSIQYAQGQQLMETKTAYTAVEVSEEAAARLPQFRKGN